jgi:hypothetical protein
MEVFGRGWSRLQQREKKGEGEKEGSGGGRLRLPHVIFLSVGSIVP